VKYIIIASIIGLAAAAGGAGIVHWQATEYHDVAWYRANIEATKTKIAACKDNPGLAPADPGCASAGKAAMDKSIDDFIARADAKPWN